MDERYDMQRAVRDKRYKYIRNFLPQLPYAQYLDYMYKMPTMKVWQRLYDEGLLHGAQRTFFEPKPDEELYDTSTDPHEIRNLADDPKLRPVLKRMRAELRRWMLDIVDLGLLPEPDLRSRFEGAPYDGARKGGYPLEKLLDAHGSVDKLRALDDPAARYWLAWLADEATLEDLLKREPAARIVAAERLGRVDVLEQAFEDRSEWVRLMAVNALDRLDMPSDALNGLKEDRVKYVARVAQKALRDLDESPAYMPSLAITWAQRLKRVFHIDI